MCIYLQNYSFLLLCCIRSRETPLRGPCRLFARTLENYFIPGVGIGDVEHGQHGEDKCLYTAAEHIKVRAQDCGKANLQKRNIAQETGGEFLFRVLKPAGCIFVLVLFVLYMIFCFTYRNDPGLPEEPAAAVATAAQETE